MGHCEFCGQRADVHPVKYRQNTGLLVMRYIRTFAGQACRVCSRRLFWKTTLHNMVLGWWGVISIVMTPIFLIGNFVTFSRSFRLAPASESRRRVLEGEREYALNLLASNKDLDTVVGVLSQNTGLPPDDVRAYVQSLSKATAVN